MDDPIPPTSGLDPSVRLHDTIKRLIQGMTFMSSDSTVAEQAREWKASRIFEHMRRRSER